MNTNHDDPRDQVLQNVDERRRGFLGKLLVGGAAVVGAPAMSSFVLAQDAPAARGKGKGGPTADPAALATRMIQEFDKDGDGALNQAELTAAITAAHQRAGKGKGGAAKGGGAAGGKGKGGGAGGGKGKGGGAAGGKGKGGGAGGGKGKGRRG
jgi:hypothetical protein